MNENHDNWNKTRLIKRRNETYYSAKKKLLQKSKKMKKLKLTIEKTWYNLVNSNDTINAKKAKIKCYKESDYKHDLVKQLIGERPIASEIMQKNVKDTWTNNL